MRDERVEPYDSTSETSETSKTEEADKAEVARTEQPAVGYKKPPSHSRFKPGQSGNPSGRPKGTQNLRTLFQKILKEEVSLREGSEVRKVTKAEAILRGPVVGAMKGDPRSVVALFKLAEQTGQLSEQYDTITQINRIIITGVPRPEDFPANSEINKEDP